MGLLSFRAAWASALALAILLGASPARAQDDGDPPTARVDIEIPVLIDYGAQGVEPEPEIDETLLVRSAAKRLETVLETASIVTVMSRDDLRARGYRTLADMLEEVPGFETYRSVMMWGRRIPFARGAGRTILVLWNGMPINSPHSNVNSLWYDLPIDVINRVEIVSGPGGVLWGANAFLGIVNIVTARGDDPDAQAEAQLRAGGGVGNQAAYGGSATVRESFLDGDLHVLAHVTFWSSRDAALNVPYDMFFAPFPGSPDGTITLNESSGPLETERDLCLPVVLNADYELEQSSLQFDFLGNFYCWGKEEVDPRGIRTDHFVDPETGMRWETGASTRVHRSTVAQLQWRKPFGDDDRFTARTYWVGIVKDFTDEVFAPAGQFGDEAITATYEYGGSNRILNDGGYRLGANTEANFEMSRNSLIAGLESMYEGRRPWVVKGAGTDILTIYEDGEVVSARTRLVAAAYAHDKVRVLRNLSAEAGLRVQAAFGEEAVAYDPLALPSGALVWNPAGKTYLKLNFATGFRPPHVSQGVADTGVGSTYYGITDPLEPERSRAAEAEISTIALENTRTVRRAHLRLGYQLSELTDLVLGRTGDLHNAGTRIIHTIETRADVAFSRGHRLVFAGHLFAGADSEGGPVRNVANYKLHLAADAMFTENLRGMVATTVLGPREDLNRLPLAAQSSAVDYVMPVGSVVVDRTPPVALVRAGLRAVDLWGDRFDLSAYIENAFDARPAIPDIDFEKKETPFPLQMPGRSFYVALTGRL